MSMSLDLVSVTTGQYGSLTGTNALDVPCPLPAGKWEFVSASHGATVAVTANDTNFATFQVRKAATVVASKTTAITGGSGNITILTATALAAAASLGQNAVFDGATEIPILAITKTGTGVTVQGVITAYFRKVSN
jgi:hypothetical protein